MKHNLMGKEKIENLGYSEVNTYENEEAVSLKNSSDIFRENVHCLKNYVKSIKWQNVTFIECGDKMKLTIICTMFDSSQYKVCLIN